MIDEKSFDEHKIYFIKFIILNYFKLIFAQTGVVKYSLKIEMTLKIYTTAIFYKHIHINFSYSSLFVAILWKKEELNKKKIL